VEYITFARVDDAITGVQRPDHQVHFLSSAEEWRTDAE
jgi:hypothetical protein